MNKLKKLIYIFLLIILTASYLSIGVRTALAGRCVKDIYVNADNGNGVIYKYSGNSNNADSNLEKPLTYWDVSDGQGSKGDHTSGFMNISLVYSNNHAECLDKIAFYASAGSNVHSAPNSGSTTNPWKRVGWWYARSAGGVGPGGYHNGSGTIVTMFKRSANSNSKQIASDFYQSNFTAKPNYYFDDVTCSTGLSNSENCIGGFSDQGGQTKYFFYSKYSNYHPTKPVKPNYRFTGSWQKIDTCVNCGNSKIMFTTGVTYVNTNSTSKQTSETSVSTATAALSGGNAFVKATATLGFSISNGQTDKTDIINTFKTEKTTTITSSCDRGQWYQWRNNLKSCSKGICSLLATGLSDKRVCTTFDDVPPKPDDYDWKACEAYIVETEVTQNNDQPSDVTFSNTGEYKCKRDKIGIFTGEWKNMPVSKNKGTPCLRQIMKVALGCNGKFHCTAALSSSNVPACKDSQGLLADIFKYTCSRSNDASGIQEAAPFLKKYTPAITEAGSLYLTCHR